MQENGEVLAASGAAQHSSEPAVSPIAHAHARGRAALLLALPLISSSMLAFEFLGGREESMPPAMLLSISITAALGWMGFFARRWRGLSMLVFATGLASIHAILSLFELEQPPPVGPPIMAVLVWSGLLIRPRWNVLIALYCLGLAWLIGIPLELTALDAGPPALHLPQLIVFTAAALAIGSLFHAHNRDVEARLLRVVEELKHRQSALELDLQRKAEELDYSLAQLLEAQKLEGIRTIAAGLAHELNNILTPIRGLTELIVDRHRDPQTQRYGRRILQSAVSAASITEALMAYTRQGNFHPVRTEISRLLADEIIPEVRKHLPENITMNTRITPGIHANVDRALLQRCIGNLVLNAVDAMPDGGSLAIELRGPHDSDGEVEPGQCLLSIRDTGGGIPEQHLDRIFEPFFTTKAVGAGRGLGLPMVQGTVTRHGGQVHLASNAGTGTTFFLRLPVAEHQPMDAPADEAPLTGGARPPVMVVAADQDVIDELEELLFELECTPNCISTVEEAEELLRGKGPIRLLLVSDEVVRPGSYGMFKAAHEAEVPIVITVADPSSPAVHSVDFLGPIRCVRSPMDPAILTEVITSVLRENTRNPPDRPASRASSQSHSWSVGLH